MIVLVHPNQKDITVVSFSLTTTKINVRHIDIL